MHLMIDIETLATAPDATILTVAAQAFDPLGQGYYQSSYYARVDFESQADRAIEQGTLDWWAKQSEFAREEAFSESDRKPLDQVLDELGKLIWKSSAIWANGPTFDMTILENAYKSYKKPLPWQYYKVRDCRTVYMLWPNEKFWDAPVAPTLINNEVHRPASHHALDDCRRQIDLLQETLKQIGIKDLA
jgi:hypothetical protein